MVAVKSFKEAHLDNLVMRLAVREAKVLSLSCHPNLVKMLAAYKSRSGRVYLVFDYVEASVHDRLERYLFGLPSAQTKIICWQLLSGVAYLHENKIVHRDIKPANILLSNEDVVKLCDFGFARELKCGLREAQDCTPYTTTRWYRAPEVLFGDSYGPSADVWSIGCTIAEIATGRPVFPGKSTADQLWRIVSCLGQLTIHQTNVIATNPDLRSRALATAPPPITKTLRQRLPELEPRLFHLIEACLRLEPLERPTARELLQLPYFWDVACTLAGTRTEAAFRRTTTASTAVAKPAGRGAAVDVPGGGASPVSAAAAAPSGRKEPSAVQMPWAAEATVAPRVAAPIVCIQSVAPPPATEACSLCPMVATTVTAPAGAPASAPTDGCRKPDVDVTRRLGGVAAHAAAVAAAVRPQAADAAPEQRVVAASAGSKGNSHGDAGGLQRSNTTSGNAATAAAIAGVMSRSNSSVSNLLRAMLSSSCVTRLWTYDCGSRGSGNNAGSGVSCGGGNSLQLSMANVWLERPLPPSTPPPAVADSVTLNQAISSSSPVIAATAPLAAEGSMLGSARGTTNLSLGSLSVNATNTVISTTNTHKPYISHASSGGIWENMATPVGLPTPELSSAGATLPPHNPPTGRQGGGGSTAVGCYPGANLYGRARVVLASSAAGSSMLARTITLGEGLLPSVFVEVEEVDMAAEHSSCSSKKSIIADVKAIRFEGSSVHRAGGSGRFGRGLRMTAARILKFLGRDGGGAAAVVTQGGMFSQQEVPPQSPPLLPSLPHAQHQQQRHRRQQGVLAKDQDFLRALTMLPGPPGSSQGDTAPVPPPSPQLLLCPRAGAVSPAAAAALTQPPPAAYSRHSPAKAEAKAGNSPQHVRRDELPCM